MRHRTVAQLERHLDHLRDSPCDLGTVELLVVRPGVGKRHLLEAGEIDIEEGVLGDTWSTRPARGRPDGSPHPDKQVTVMNHRMVSLLGDDPEERALAGDQLYVDLDLSFDNVPTDSWLHVGSAVLKVTSPPHLGCAKFVKAYGTEAMQFVNSSVGRELRLRGLNTRVLTGGVVRRGDVVRVERAAAAVAAARLTGPRTSG